MARQQHGLVFDVRVCAESRWRKEHCVGCGWCGLETRREHANAWVQTDYSPGDANDGDMPYNQAQLTTYLSKNLACSILHHFLMSFRKNLARYFVHDTTESTTILPYFSENNVWTL